MTTTGESGAGRDALPVVEDWFRIRDVAPGLSQIDEPYAHEFVRGNIWWRRGRDRDLVVDTGLGVASLHRLLEAAAAARGRTWREPIVVLTHGHLDHAGGAAEFGDVRAHPGDVPAGVTSLDAPTFARQVGLAPSPLLPSGALVTAAVRADWDPALHDTGSIRTKPLEGGSVVDLGDRQYEVLHAPGHTPGSIVLFDRVNRELFSGDVAYDDDLLDDLHGSDTTSYLRSMEILRALDVKTVRPGHGASFDRFVLHRVIDDYMQSRTAAAAEAAAAEAAAAEGDATA